MKPSLLTFLALVLAITLAGASSSAEKKTPVLRGPNPGGSEPVQPGYCGAVLSDDVVTQDDGVNLDYTNVDDTYRNNDDFPLNDFYCWK